MNNSKPRHDNWDPCHPGLLHEAAQDVAVSRRRLFQAIAAGVSIVVLAGGAVMGTWLSGTDQKPSDQVPAGLSCITVVDFIPSLLADEITDEGMTRRIRCHIIKCECCRKTYDEMRCSGDTVCKSRPKNPTIKPCPDHPPSP